MHVLVAIDRDAGAAPKDGLPARQVGHESGRLYRSAEPAHRHLCTANRVSPSRSPRRNAPIRCVVHIFRADAETEQVWLRLVSESRTLLRGGTTCALPTQIPKGSSMTLTIPLVAARG